MRKALPRLHGLVLLAAVLLFAGAARAGTWQIDPAHTSAQFAVRHLVVSKVRGHLGEVRGTVSLDEVDPTKSTVRATVDVAGIDTGNSERDDHLRQEEYFDVAHHPTITFVSKRVARKDAEHWTVTGDLTLRGVTREIVLEIEGAAAPIRDPWGKTRLGGVAHTTLRREDFGVGTQKTFDGGGLVIGDEVEVTIDVELTRGD